MKRRTLRVCLVTLDNPYFHREDGVAVYTYFLSINLARLGCEVHVLGLSKNVDRKRLFTQHGVTFHCYPDFKGRGRPLRFLFFLKKMAKAVLVLSRHEKFDVVHGQGGYASAVAFAKCLGLRSKCVATVHTVGFDEQMMTAKDYWSSGFHLTGLYNILSMPPPMIMFHGDFVYNQMDVNISISEYNRHRASLIYNVPLGKVITIPPAVDESVYNIPLRFGDSQPNSPLLLYVGRLAPRKGVQYLLQAIRHIARYFPKIRLIIVGKGPYERYLRDLSRKLDVQNSVVFLGYVDRRELYRLYASADVVVIPSLFEGVPQVLLEAMAAGKPVVASAVQGIPEVIKDGFSGLLIKPCDIHGIVSAVTIILQDRKFAEYLAKNARRTIIKDYNWEKNARRTLEVYKEL